MTYLPTITTPYLKTYLSNKCDEKIDEIDKKVNNLSQDVIKNTNDISSLNNKINKVEEDVNKKINELNTKITNNANDISTINNKIINIESNNKIITDKVNEHESRIRTLESYSNSGSIFYDGNIFKKVDEKVMLIKFNKMVLLNKSIMIIIYITNSMIIRYIMVKQLVQDFML